MSTETECNSPCICTNSPRLDNREFEGKEELLLLKQIRGISS